MLLYTASLYLRRRPHVPVINIFTRGLSRRKWSPATTGPAGPSMADLVAIDGPAGPSMGAMDGPLCRKSSPHQFCYKYLQLATGL